MNNDFTDLAARVAVSGATGTVTEEFPLLTLAEFFGMTDEDYDWMIVDYLLQGCLVMFAGSSKAGKTELLLQTLCRALLEKTAFGKECKEFPVIYLDYENPRIHTRKNLQRVLGSAEDARELMKSRRFVVGSNTFYEDKKEKGALPNPLTVDYLKKLVGHYDKPGIIVADTLRDAFGSTPKLPPRWEDDAGFMRKLMRPFQQFAHQSGWTVLFIHHFNKAGGISGSTEMKACVDLVWDFTRPENQTKATLSITGRIPNVDPLGFDYDTAGKYVFTGIKKKDYDSVVEFAMRECVKLLKDKSQSGEDLAKALKYMKTTPVKVTHHAMKQLKAANIVQYDTKSKVCSLVPGGEMLLEVKLATDPSTKVA